MKILITKHHKMLLIVVVFWEFGRVIEPVTKFSGDKVEPRYFITYIFLKSLI